MLGTAIGFVLSPRAQMLLKLGKAVLTPGGIRDVATGHIIELVKPVLQVASKAGSPLGWVNLASTALSSGYTAYKLTGMDKKLDGMVRQLSEIAKAVSHIQTVELLQYASVGLQLANVAVTAVGFYMTMQKLNDIGGELHAFYDRYQEDRDTDELEKYRTYMNQITGHMGYLKMRYETEIFDERDFLNRSNDIERDCSGIASFLQKVRSEIMSGKIGHALACQILFTLTPAYAELVNEYCCQYRCYLGRRNPQFDTCRQVLEMINDRGFIQFMQREMAFNPYYVGVSPEKRHEALQVAFGSIAKSQENLMVRDKVLDNVPAKSPITIVDERLNEQAWETLGREMGATTEEAITGMLMRGILQTNAPNNAPEPFFVTVQAVTA